MELFINPALYSNGINASDFTENLDSDLFVIDICDYNSIEDLYPAMSNPIVIDDIEFDLDSIDIEILETPMEFCWNNYNNMDLTTSAKNQGRCGGSDRVGQPDLNWVDHAN